MGSDMPHLTRVDGRPRLIVDGRPFLILGLQWDCDSCFSAEEMNPLLAQAAAMGANTAALPLYWREIEPEPDRYDFTMLDERVRQAEAHDLRLVLLWFATWKNACSFYAPDYIQSSPDRYRPARDRAGRATVSLCSLGEETWQRDAEALAAVMEHLRTADTTHRVILLQVENEPGLLGSDRCYCPTCNAQFATGDWEARYGVHAAEAFSVANVTTYIDRLAAHAKAIYPLPMYMNVWMARPVGGIAGQEYPSGGAVHFMLDLARKHAPHLDLIAPDIYTHGYRDFHWACQVYGGGDFPLYVAEHSSAVSGRAERNVYYAIGQYGALGFDPWAIDSPFPERTGPPLVDPLGGEWGPQAYWMRDSYVAIGRAMTPIAEAQGSDRLFTFVQEPGEGGVTWAAGGCDVRITYADREGAGRGLVIRRGDDEFLLVGNGFQVSFHRPRPDGRPRAILLAEWGRFEDTRWVTLHPMRRERLESEGHPLTFLEPGVASVHLAALA